MNLRCCQTQRSGLNPPDVITLGSSGSYLLPPHPHCGDLRLLNQVMLSCLWAFFQAVLPVFSPHRVISWVTPMILQSTVQASLPLWSLCFFLEITYLAAIYWAPMYQELWDVLGKWEWLRQSILGSFIDEMKGFLKKSFLNDIWRWHA